MANHNVVFVEENGTDPAPLVKRRLERFAERDKREIKNNFSAVPAQSERGAQFKSSGGGDARPYPRSISLYSHASASERPPSSSMSFSFTARRPSSTVPMSITSSPVWSISWV